jgi:formylmethanofuran dehydrogenase subunit E
MVNSSMYDPMDLFTCSECGKREDRDLSYKVNDKLVCGDCAEKLLDKINS